MWETGARNRRLRTMHARFVLSQAQCEWWRWLHAADIRQSTYSLMRFFTLVFVLFAGRLAVFMLGLFTLIVGIVLSSIPWVDYFIYKVSQWENYPKHQHTQIAQFSLNEASPVTIKWRDFARKKVRMPRDYFLFHPTFPIAFLRNKIWGTREMLYLFHWRCVFRTFFQNLRLWNGTISFHYWQKPGVVRLTKIYIFNVTNPDGFLNYGEKPRLNEIGPFVYRSVCDKHLIANRIWLLICIIRLFNRENMEKVNVVFHENRTLSFQHRKILHFVPELSVGDPKQLITVPNIPLLVCEEYKIQYKSKVTKFKKKNLMISIYKC